MKQQGEIAAVGSKLKTAGQAACLAMMDFNIAFEKAGLKEAEQHFDPVRRRTLSERSRARLHAAERKRRSFAATGTLA